MSEPRITPRLGRPRPYMSTACGFGIGEPLCDKPATWHIVWDPTLEHSLACDEHMAYAGRYVYYDRHPITDVCTFPGAAFIWSWEEPPGRCVWVIDDEQLVAEANADPSQEAVSDTPTRQQQPVRQS